MEQNTIKANMEVVGRRRYIAGNTEYCSKEIQWTLVLGIRVIGNLKVEMEQNTIKANMEG